MFKKPGKLFSKSMVKNMDWFSAVIFIFNVISRSIFPIYIICMGKSYFVAKFSVSGSVEISD